MPGRTLYDRSAWIERGVAILLPQEPVEAVRPDVWGLVALELLGEFQHASRQVFRELKIGGVPGGNGIKNVAGSKLWDRSVELVAPDGSRYSKRAAERIERRRRMHPDHVVGARNDALGEGVLLEVGRNDDDVRHVLRGHNRWVDKQRLIQSLRRQVEQLRVLESTQRGEDAVGHQSVSVHGEMPRVQLRPRTVLVNVAGRGAEVARVVRAGDPEQRHRWRRFDLLYRDVCDHRGVDDRRRLNFD